LNVSGNFTYNLTALYVIAITVKATIAITQTTADRTHQWVSEYSWTSKSAQYKSFRKGVFPQLVLTT